MHTASFLINICMVYSTDSWRYKLALICSMSAIRLTSRRTKKQITAVRYVDKEDSRKETEKWRVKRDSLGFHVLRSWLTTSGIRVVLDHQLYCILS